MGKNIFDDFQQRLNILRPTVREAALKYAEELYSNNKMSRVEALESGIQKAEMENRQL